MKKILLVSFVLAALAAGCGSSRTFASGYISLGWTLVDHAGFPLTCADVDAVTLQLKATPLNGGNVRVELFDCAAMSATTDLLPGGDYHVEIDLLDSQNRALNTLTPSTTFTIDGNTVDLGDFAFQFSNV